MLGAASPTPSHHHCEGRPPASQSNSLAPARYPIYIATTAASAACPFPRAAFSLGLAVEHHLAADLHTQVRHARDFFGISSTTVTMNVTVSPIFTGRGN